MLPDTGSVQADSLSLLPGIESRPQDIQYLLPGTEY
jgi:hypothetical protein